MTQLIIEMLAYLGAAALLGLIIGYLIWGWRWARRLANARAEGVASARTTVDGSAALREQLSDSKHERERLEREIATLRHRIEAQQATPPRAKAPVATATATDTATDASAEQDALRREIDRGEQERERLTREIALLRERLEKAQAEIRAAPSQTSALKVLEEELAHCAQARERLEIENATLVRELDALRNAEADFPSDAVEMDPAPEMEVEAPQAPAQAPPPTPAPASLLSERPDEVDNLKKIKGVGPKMERILNEKGVYLFQQVATFSPSDIAWINDAIDAFPGRIERDDWVGQARALYELKYGPQQDED